MRKIFIWSGSHIQLVAPVLITLLASAPVVEGADPLPTASLLAVDADWAQAYAAKNLKKAVAFCDEAASMLVPNAPIASGKAAVSKAIADDMASNDLTWHANKAGIARSQDLGYTTGVYHMKFKDASGRVKVDNGKFLTLWKREADGTWKMLYDMFNSDLPPSSP
jgi:ketosteroid isomerase-like protein